MKIHYLLKPDGNLKDVELFTTDDKKFDLNKTYTVVINHYMASVYKYEHQDAGQGLFRASAEATIDYLRGLKNIPSYRGVKRIEIIK